MLDGDDDAAEGMNDEAKRRGSFENRGWPHAGGGLEGEAMAGAGFFYAPRFSGDDRVVCFSCGGTLSDWRGGVDEPWEQHVTWFPECRFVTIPEETANIPASLPPPGEEWGGGAMEEVTWEFKGRKWAGMILSSMHLHTAIAGLRESDDASVRHLGVLLLTRLARDDGSHPRFGSACMPHLCKVLQTAKDPVLVAYACEALDLVLRQPSCRRVALEGPGADVVRVVMNLLPKWSSKGGEEWGAAVSAALQALHHVASSSRSLPVLPPRFFLCARSTVPSPRFFGGRARGGGGGRGALCGSFARGGALTRGGVTGGGREFLDQGGGTEAVVCVLRESSDVEVVR